MQTILDFREVYAWGRNVESMVCNFLIDAPPGIEGGLKQFIHVLCYLAQERELICLNLVCMLG